MSDTDLKWFEKECWQSTKYPFDQMDPQEMKQTWVPELGMMLGPLSVHSSRAGPYSNLTRIEVNLGGFGIMQKL
ncbi:MAG: hypothetical protein WA364_27205 [Candidatus Nitrosopolaris sp.]